MADNRLRSIDELVIPERGSTSNLVIPTEVAGTRDIFRQKQQPIKKIKPDIIDQIQKAWNPVGQTIRDLGMEKFGKALQPETIVVDGVRHLTNNTTFHDFTKDEVNTELNNLTTTPDKADGAIYKLSNPKTGEVKYGKTGDDVWNRYSSDGAFRSNWVVDYNRPMSDTAYAERLIHGLRGARDTQASPYESKNKIPLTAGRTEVYTSDPLMKTSLDKVDTLLTPIQRNLANKLYDYERKVGQTLKTARTGIMKNTLDTVLGAGIGLNKIAGGLNALTGNTSGQELAQKSSKILSETMTDKDSLYSTVGEIVPELVLPVALKAPTIIKGLAGRIGYGGLTGAGLTGGYEAIKEQSGIKEGLPTDIAMATGIGGVIGGIVGGLTKNPALGKTIGEAFVAGDDKAKEAILQTYPEARGAVDEYFRTNKPVPSTVQPVFNKSTVTKSDAIEPDIIQLQKKQTVRPTSKKTTIQDVINPTTGDVQTISNFKTKNNTEIKSQDVLEGRQNIQGKEYEIVSAKDKQGKELKNQTFVPKVDNDLKHEYFSDVVGRIHTKQGHLLGTQTDATQMAMHREKVKPEIESAVNEVSRRTQFYDASEALRQRYGQKQASYKEHEMLSDKQMEANRLQFEKDQFTEIGRDKTLSSKIRREAKKQLKELEKVDIKDYIATKAQKAIIEEKFLAQHKIPNKSSKAIKERETDLAEEYSIYKESKETRNKEGYDANDMEAFIKRQEKLKAEGKPFKEVDTSFIKTPEQIREQVKLNATELSKQATKDKISLETQIAESGKKVDFANITDEQRASFRDQIANIEDIQNARIDLHLYNKGKIDSKQLQHREKRRIEDRLKREKKDSFKSKEEVQEYVDSVIKKHNDIGVYVKSEDVKFKETYTAKKPETAKKKAEREKKEIEKSQIKHDTVVKALEEYQTTKKVPRHMTTEKAGQPRLTKAQMKQVDKELLLLDEIADQSAPVGKLEDIADLKSQAKEKANAIDTSVEQSYMRLDWKTRPKNIRFKTTVQDVANSVGQITAVLLSSLRLGKLTKTAGSRARDAFGNIKELRNEIGLQMEKNGVKKPIVIKNGKELTWKDLIKPTFMTKNYGQQAKGLIRNIQKDFGLSLKDATKFLEDYEKAFMQVAPEMKEFEQRVLQSFKNGEAKIEWDMPDGFPVRIQMKKTTDGTYSLKGELEDIKLVEDGISNLSTGILPHIIQSADSFIMRYMNKHGIAGNHDAFFTPAGKTDEFVRETYGKAMSELNDNDVIGKILESLGDYKGSPKVGDLKNEDIMKSARKAESLEPEEIAGQVKKADAREIDLGIRKTKTDVMKEFMARNNVRQVPTNQLLKSLVQESAFNKETPLSLTRTGDDVFERQIALAHQSPNYNSRQSLKAPKGADAKEWDKAQREIFAEARARLENNPLLNGIIQGERKFFNENGRLIGDKTKTYHELKREEIIRGNLEIRRLNQEAKKAVKAIAPTYERLQIKVKSWEAGKKLTNAESIAKEVVYNARQLTPVKSQFKKNIDKFKAYFKDQVSDSKITKDFDNLLNFRKSREGFVGEKEEKLEKDLSRRFKGTSQKELTDSILKTDFHAIKDFKNEKETEWFMNYNKDVYKSFKDYIDQSAKAIGEASEQVGFFRNNARAILAEHNIENQPVLEEIIDKMISIKAMTPESWKTIEKIKDTEDFKYVMEIIRNNKERSKQLFHNNPNQQVKGYVEEVYDGKYLIGKDGKIHFDAENTDELGAVPVKLENKKVGHYEENLPSGNFSNIREKSEYAKENKLKMNQDGTFRKVADAELKDKAGRSNSFSHILAKTTASIDGKETQQLIAKNIIDEMVKGNEMFSQTPKAGYRLIEDNEVTGMPKVVADSLAGRYVLEAYDKRLFGRDEVRLYSGASQVGKIADRLLKETTTMFKQNVVVKNLNSYLNATMVNQLLGSMSGINQAKLLKYQKQAIDEIKLTDSLKEKIAVLEARGQDTKALQAELEKSLLYKLEEAGLAINKLEVAGDDSTLMGTILSKYTGDTDIGNWIGNNVAMTQKSWIGNKAFKLFGTIDTQGRYTIAKNAIDNGKTIKEAVKEANGLFSDMGQMSPAFIELMDKYPFIPFMKWASLTMPRLMRLTKENPVKAFALGIAVYGLQIETDTNLATVNPLESVVNFADDAVTPSYINASIDKGVGEATWDKVKTFYVPKVYSEIQKELENPDTHDFILKNRIKGEFQPLTQRGIDD